jgi:membrane protease YdiL (CAAX protease family)
MLAHEVEKAPWLSLAIFYALAFAISWGLWAPLVAARLAGSGGPPTWLHLAGSLGPAFAALVTAALIHGRATVTDLLRALSPRRMGRIGWVVGLGGPLLLFATGISATAVETGAGPDLSRALRSVEYPYLGPVALIAAQIVCYGVGEEMGWRGLALPLLMRRMSPMAASALLTLPWALWHLPLFMTNEAYIQMGLGGVLGWLFSLLTGSFLMGWLFLATGRSLLAVALFHGLLDLALVNPVVSQLGMNVAGALVTIGGITVAVNLRRMRADDG